MKKRPIVRVEWIDSAGPEEGQWIAIGDALDMKPQTIVTIGHLLTERRTYITIASGIGAGYCSGVIVIPKCAINEMAYLKVGEWVPKTEPSGHSG